MGAEAVPHQVQGSGQPLLLLRPTALSIDMTAGVVITVAASSLVCSQEAGAGDGAARARPLRPVDHTQDLSPQRTSTMNCGGWPLEAGSGDCEEAQKQDGGWHWEAGHTAGNGGASGGTTAG